MKKLYLTLLLAFVPLLCVSQNRKRYPWRIQYTGGYAVSGMRGPAARSTAILHVESFLTGGRSTYTYAGERWLGSYWWFVGIARKISPFMDIGLGIGQATMGGYARIDTLSSGYQFRRPVWKRVDGKGKNAFVLHYLFVPVSLQLHPLKKQRNLYLLVQGWYASLSSATKSVDFRSRSKDPRDQAHYRSDAYKDFKHDNLGSSLGAGYTLSLLNHLDISAEIRYSRGWDNVGIKNINNLPYKAFVRSVSIGISTAFLF